MKPLKTAIDAAAENCPVRDIASTVVFAHCSLTLRASAAAAASAVAAVVVDVRAASAAGICCSACRLRSIKQRLRRRWRRRQQAQVGLANRGQRSGSELLLQQGIVGHRQRVLHRRLSANNGLLSA